MKLTGVITALVTPFDADGEIDLRAMERLLERQFEEGASGVLAGGTTGEYYTLTPEERVRTLEFVSEWVGGRGLLIAGTNGSSTREVIEHSRRAEQLGYEAILLAPPNCARPTQHELIEHYRAVLAAVGTELILYDLPSHAGVEVGFEVLDAFAANPRVIGIKESSGNVVRAAEIVRRYGGAYQVCAGADYQALDLFLWGASAWIVGSANCFAPQTNALMRAVEAADIERARREAARLAPALAVMETGKFIQKAKYGCELAGIPVGDARRPHLPLSPQEKEEFRQGFNVAYASSGKTKAA